MVTYAQVAKHPARHRVRTEARSTLVIFDEIHHGGDAKSWGDAILEAFGDATRRLALTGTPFAVTMPRSPSYATSRWRRSAALASRPHLRLHRRAGRRRGAAGGVPGVFRRDPVAGQRGCGIRGAARRARYRRTHRTRLAHRVGPGRRVDACRRDRGRHPAPAAARGRGTGRRRHDHRFRSAGCPRLCRSAATDYRRSPDARAVRRPRVFRADRTVLPRHQSLAGRGADGVRGCRRAEAGCRRLRDECLHPAVLRSGHRPVRPVRRPGEIASVFLPSVPTLLLLASELEAQRNHVLGQPDRETDELAEAQRRQNEPSEIDKSSSRWVPMPNWIR